MKKKILSLVLVAVLALAAIGGTLAYFTDTDTTDNTFAVGNVKLDLYEHSIDGQNTEVEEIKYEDAIVPGHVFAKDPTIELLKAGETTTTGQETPYDSEDAYVFLDMTINKYKSLFPVMALDAVANVDSYTQDMFNACLDNNVFSSQKFLSQMASNKTVFQAIMNRWFTGINHSAWQLCDVYYNCGVDDVTVNGDYLTFRFAYIGDTDGTIPMEAGDSVTFMTAFQMPTTVTQDMIENNYVANDFNTASEPFHMNFTAYAIQADTMADLSAAYKALFNDEIADPLTLTVR